jgi:hypothetical protein
LLLSRLKHHVHDSVEVRPSAQCTGKRAVRPGTSTMNLRTGRWRTSGPSSVVGTCSVRCAARGWMTHGRAGGATSRPIMISQHVIHNKLLDKQYDLTGTRIVQCCVFICVIDSKRCPETGLNRRRRPFKGVNNLYLQLLTGLGGLPEHGGIRIKRANHGWGITGGTLLGTICLHFQGPGSVGIVIPICDAAEP